jgi:hypothetical protein
LFALAALILARPCLSESGNEFSLAVGSGLPIEDFEVVLDRVWGQLKAPRYLFDGISLEEKVHNVELARGQLVPGGQGRQQLIGGGRLQEDGHAPAAERAGRQAQPAP